jgi:hypothetical protein
VTPPPADRSFEDAAESSFETALKRARPPAPPAASPDADESTVSRINFRLPDHLKLRIEEAAGKEGLSINTWLVRVAAATLEPDDRGRRTERRSGRGGQRYTGWAR